MIRKLNICITITSLLLLCGCYDSSGRVGKEGSPIWMDRTTNDEKARYYKTVCREYGFEYDTPEMAECVGDEIRSAKGRADKKWDNFDRQMESLAKNVR